MQKCVIYLKRKQKLIRIYLYCVYCAECESLSVDCGVLLTQPGAGPFNSFWTQFNGIETGFWEYYSFLWRVKKIFMASVLAGGKSTKIQRRIGPLYFDLKLKEICSNSICSGIYFL